MYSYLGLCSEFDTAVVQGDCPIDRSYKFLASVVNYFKVKQYAENNPQQIQAMNSFVDHLVIPQAKTLFQPGVDVFHPKFLHEVGYSATGGEQKDMGLVDLASRIHVLADEVSQLESLMQEEDLDVNRMRPATSEELNNLSSLAQQISRRLIEVTYLFKSNFLQESNNLPKEDWNDVAQKGQELFNLRKKVCQMLTSIQRATSSKRPESSSIPDISPSSPIIQELLVQLEHLSQKKSQSWNNHG
eukprot:TRINITY_DN9795_c0_g2_i2.p1 TRINITY_DN9795_c0_g2~~TRINITY_DN9795_c0_g2_i2.p1  ORF type:complete len:244 (-),score=69.48 TRINITY_DN9795_c0_g2_i2:546-1277(-)